MEENQRSELHDFVGEFAKIFELNSSELRRAYLVQHIINTIQALIQKYIKVGA